MANLFENIVRPVGQGISGLARGLFPGAAREADLSVLQREIAMAGGPFQPAGQQLLLEYFNKIKASPELKEKVLQSKGMFGGALGGIMGQQAGMIPESISIDEKGMPRLTLERGPTEREMFKETTGYANELRDEYNALSKDFFTVRDAYNRVTASAEEPSAAGDLALIFNYMKVLDPGSVVRESEFSTAAQAGAYGERIKAAVGRIISGERLSDEMRTDFVNRAKRLYDAQEKTHTRLKERYRRLGTHYKIEPKFIFGETEEITKASSPDETVTPDDIESRLTAVRARMAELTGEKSKAIPPVSLPEVETEASELPPIKLPKKPSPEVSRVVDTIPKPTNRRLFRDKLRHIYGESYAKAYYEKWKNAVGENEKFETLWRPLSGKR